MHWNDLGFVIALTFDCLLDAALHSISTEMAWRFELSIFSQIHKNKYYTSLTSQHLVQQLRVICSDTKPDIKRIIVQGKQYSLSTHKCLTDACKI